MMPSAPRGLRLAALCACCALALVLSACAAQQEVTVQRETAQTFAPTALVAVLRQLPTQPYVRIAVLDVQASAGTPVVQLLAQLQAKAGALGPTHWWYKTSAPRRVAPCNTTPPAASSPRRRAWWCRICGPWRCASAPPRRSEMGAMKTRFVIATRESYQGFFSKTATGRSLARMMHSPVEARVFPDNQKGLPEVYNIAIAEAAGDPANLVFIHDDVHILDYFLPQRVDEGLNVFDLIGVAGNKRRVNKQPAWAFVDANLTWDAREHLSGIVAHGKTFPPRQLSNYGEPRCSVKLLDGVLLAARSDRLLSCDLRFDEEFDFHFYDVDFCRQAEVKAMTCGTWDLAIMHESGGGFGGEGWRQNYQRYIGKWGN